MASLFISYSRKDIETARKLTEAFKDQKLDFWIDWEGIPPTVDWWKEIEKGIEEADIFLFLISPDSCKSKICKQEIEHAAKNGKRLIPLVVRDIKADESPSELGALNWIFLRESDDFTGGFRKLITAIKTDYPWVQAHRQLLVKALEWEKGRRKKDFLLRGEELQEAEVQVASNTSKEPHPTDLQREYVLKSRQEADRQRRNITTITISVAIITTMLAFVALVQKGLADERATISRARELAAQSVALRDSDFQASLLLGVEAFRTLDTVQTRGVLLDNAQEKPQLKRFLQDPAFLGTGISSGSVTLSPDGKIQASTSEDNTIILMDVETGEQIGAALQGHTDTIYSLGFSPDGTKLASGGADGTIILWDAKTQARIGQPLGVNEGTVFSIAFGPDDGKTLAAASGHTITLWDVETHYPIGQPLRAHVSAIRSVAFRPDGKTLVSEGTDQSIYLWDVSGALHRSEEILPPIAQPLRGHITTVRSVAFHPDGTILASGSGDGTIILWDVATGKIVRQLPSTDETTSLHSLAFQPGPRGNMLAASSGSEIFLWDLSTLLKPSLEPRQLTDQPLRGHFDFIHSLSFSPDGTILASASEDKSVILWDVGTGKPMGEPLRGHEGAVISLAYSPDGQILASGSEDQSVILWNVETRQPIVPPLKGHSFGVWSLAFSPDGKLLASGSLDESIVLWNVKTGKSIGVPLRGHTSDILSLAFSPDGKTLASGSDDNTIILWDVESGQIIGQPLSGHTDSVWSVAFSPDGKKLASSGYDTYILLWDIDPQFLIQKACERVGRNFIQAQWIQYFLNQDYHRTCEEFPRHPSFYQELARRILLDPEEPEQVQKALDEVKLQMDTDAPIKNPTVEVAQIVAEMAAEGISEEVNNNQWEEALSLLAQTDAHHLPLDPLLTDSGFLHTFCWNGSLEGFAAQVLEYCERAVDLIPNQDDSSIPYLRDQARVMANQPSSSYDEYLLYDLCWDGSLDGYASQVMKYCERAVDVAPDDPDIRDGRGLARALAGDIAGAIEDFQFYVDQSGNQSRIQARQEWILDLKAGINPFTSEVLEQLRYQ